MTFSAWQAHVHKVADVTGRSWPMAEWTALAFANYPAEEVAIAVWRDLNRPSLTEMIARTNTLPR